MYVIFLPNYSNSVSEYKQMRMKNKIIRFVFWKIISRKKFQSRKIWKKFITTHPVYRSVDEYDYYAWDVERQDWRTNDEIWIMEFTSHFVFRNICFPEETNESNFEFWKKNQENVLPII